MSFQDELEKRRKAAYGKSYSPVSGQTTQQATGSGDFQSRLDARRKAAYEQKPVNNEQKNTTKTTQPTQAKQPSILDKIGNVASTIKKGFDVLLNKVPEKKSFVSPIPEKDVITKPDTITPFTLAGNIVDSARKDINEGLGDLSKGVVNKTYAPAAEKPVGPVGTKPSTPNGGNLRELTKRTTAEEGSLAQKINKDFGLGVTGLIEGASGGILKSSGTTQPKTVDEKIVYGVTNVLGSVRTIGGIAKKFDSLAKGSGTIGAFLEKYPKIAKVVIPWATNTLAFDVYGQLDPDTENRLQKLAEDTAAGTLFSALGGVKKGALSIPANFGVGYGLAKLQGASDEDAFIAGGILSVLDASHRAKKGLLESTFKEGSLTMTPEAIRTQARGTNFAGTRAADVLERAAAEAQTQGKDIEIVLSAAQKSRTAKIFNAQTPEGFSFSLKLVDRKEYELLDEQGEPIPSAKQGVPDVVAQELNKVQSELPTEQQPAVPEQKSLAPEAPQGTEVSNPTPPEPQTNVSRANDNFYVKQETGDAITYKKVDARPIPLTKEIETFISKEGDSFVISETKTGLHIADGETRAIAIEKAKDLLQNNSEQLQTAIKESVANGETTPRYHTPDTNTENERIKKELRIPEKYKNEVERKSFEKLIKNPAGLIDEYIQKFPHVANTDDAMELFRDAGYEEDGHNSGSVTAAASQVSRFAYEKMLDLYQGEKDKGLLATMGGAGSGKSTATLTKIGDDYALTADSTGARYKFFKENVDMALKKGYPVTIAFVYRDPLNAWENGVLVRARHVPVEAHISDHVAARESFIQAVEDYNGNENVSFVALENNGTVDQIKEIPFDFTAKISYNKDDLRKKIYETTERHYQERTKSKLTKERYDQIQSERASKQGEGQTPKGTQGQNKDALITKRVAFNSKEALTSQASFNDVLNDIRLDVRSQEDLIRKTDDAIKIAIRGKNNTPAQLAGIRTALNKELFGIIGETGNRKLDYAMLQTFKRDSDLAPYLNFLEDKILMLDQKLGRRTDGISFADREPFAELENISQQIEKNKISIIEFPEMVKLAEELMGGNRPVVTKKNKRDKYRGLFRGEGDGKILLKADIFKTPGQAAKTLAHEIGHLFDYLPNKSMAKGNLIGRIASLNQFLRNNFSSPEVEQKIDALIAKRKTLQKARQALRDEKGVIAPANKETDRDLLKQIKEINTEIKDMQKITIKNPMVKEELLALSAKWRPIAEDAKGTADEIKNNEYRASAAELYADAISVLFNDPVRLKQEAPIFWDSFFKYISRKPEAKKNLYELYDILNADPEKLFRQRDEAMEKGFTRAEEQWTVKELEKQKRQSSIVHQVSTLWYEARVLVDDRNLPVNSRVGTVKKRGGTIDDELNPAYALEGLNYIDSKIKNYIGETFQPVFEKAQEVANGWTTLGKVLQLERAIYERGELANPGGYDKKTAADQLEALEKYSSPAEWRKIQDAKVLFRRAVQRSITSAEKAGYYSPEMIELMKANPAYAAFQVVDYLDTFISAKIHKSVGTLKDIANPATSTIMKTISLVKAIERNNAKLITTDFMLKEFPKEVEKARSVFNGKTQEFVEPKNRDQALLIVLRNGKAEGYYVPKDIANSLNFMTNETITMASKISKILSISPFYRPLFTGLNLGFQTVNFARDFQRYWKNTPDYTLFQALTSLPRAAVRYGQAVPAAIQRVRELPHPIIKELEESKVLGLNYNDYFKDPVDPEQQEVERVLTKIGILEGKKRNSVIKKLMTPFYLTLDQVANFGTFIETLPKVAGYIELKNKMPKEELAHFLRNYVGSPNFRTRGEFTPVTNHLFLFSNAIKEGIKSDVKVATGRVNKQSQASFWWKTIMSTILPSLMMAGMAVGLFGQWYKDLMDGVSEYDKSNYTIIPLGLDENGKTKYLRVPRDETSRFIGAIFWKGLSTAQKKEAGIEDVMDLFSFGAGQFPNVSPSFVGAGAIITYMSGQNPYDEFRHRNVIPDQEFEAGTKYSLPIFVDWLLKNQGLSVIIPSYSPTNPTELEKALNYPVLSNVLGRWIKVSDYGKTEQVQNEADTVKKQKAEQNVKEKTAIEDAVKVFRRSKDTSTAARETAVLDTFTKLYDKLPDDQKNGQKRSALKTEVNTAFLKGESDRNLNLLIYAQSNDEKAKILQQLSKKMTATEFSDFQTNALGEKLISRETLKKYYQLTNE